MMTKSTLALAAFLMLILANPVSAQFPPLDEFLSSTSLQDTFFGDASGPASVTDTITFSSSGVLAEMALEVDITHTFLSDLVIDLSHGGLTHRLAGGTPTAGFIPTSFGLYHANSGLFGVDGPLECTFQGEFWGGDWVLDVTDAFPSSDGGVVNTWRISVAAGTPAPPAAQPATITSCGSNTTGVAVTWFEPDPANYAGIEVNISPDPTGLGTQVVLPGIQSANFPTLPPGTYVVSVATISADVCAGSGIDSCTVEVELTRPYLRADLDGSGVGGTLADGVLLLFFGFAGGPAPACDLAADVNGNDIVEPLVDALYLLNAAFAGGAPIPAPFPVCGSSIAGSLACAFSPCP